MTTLRDRLLRVIDNQAKDLEDYGGLPPCLPTVVDEAKIFIAGTLVKWLYMEDFTSEEQEALGEYCSNDYSIKFLPMNVTPPKEAVRMAVYVKDGKATVRQDDSIDLEFLPNSANGLERVTVETLEGTVTRKPFYIIPEPELKRLLIRLFDHQAAKEGFPVQFKYYNI